MPIFQGFWKDKEKEEGGFLFPVPLLSRSDYYVYSILAKTKF